MSMNILGCNSPTFISTKNKLMATGKVEELNVDDSVKIDVKFDDDFIKRAQENAMSLRQKADISDYIKPLEKTKVNWIPAYAGIYETDKAIATAVQNCSKDNQGFVYDTIRSNFLLKNTSNLTEEERLANISLGMKKAEYATQTFIPDSEKDSFMKAMETVAKIATAGVRESDGTMDYGVKNPKYLGYGSGLVYTTNIEDVMKTMDSDAYSKYQNLLNDETTEDRFAIAERYYDKWRSNIAKTDPYIYDRYEKKTEDYMKQVVSNKKLDTTFKDIDVSSKASFIESLKQFQQQRPNFLTDIINRQLTMLSKH